MSRFVMLIERAALHRGGGNRSRDRLLRALCVRRGAQSPPRHV